MTKTWSSSVQALFALGGHGGAELLECPPNERRGPAFFEVPIFLTRSDAGIGLQLHRRFCLRHHAIKRQKLAAAPALLRASRSCAFARKFFKAASRKVRKRPRVRSAFASASVSSR